MTRTVLLSIAYDGAPWSGLAVQENAPTVGGELIRALRHIDPSVSKIRVASRTDAGVHARDQRVAFDTEVDVPNRAWVRGLFPYLPSSIVVTRASTPEPGFHPRFETLRKDYRYLLLCQHRSDPFLVKRAWRVGPMNDERLAVMQEELAALVGTHDFAGFASARDQRENTERTMEVAGAQWLGSPASGDTPKVIAIDITGDGFLHNMVRIIVGTAVDVALGRLDRGAFRRALASKKRDDLGQTAPPDGLYLERLELRDEGRDPWPAPAT